MNIRAFYFLLLLTLSIKIGLSQIKISSRITSSNPEEALITKITAYTGPGKGKVDLSYQGIIRDIQFNSDRTICAINLKGGVEMNDVYLVISSLGAARLNVISDVNDRVKKLAVAAGKTIPSDYIHVDKIEKRILFISSGSKDEEEFSFKIRITSKNQLQLMKESLANY